MIVMKVDGKPFREVRKLAAVLRAKNPGEVVKLECSRRKKRRRLFDRKPWEEVVIELALPKPKAKPGEKRKNSRRWI